MAELATISLADASLTDVMRQVATLTQATVLGADEVSVTLMEGHKTATVAFTGDLAVQLDERQYEDGFGPRMDASQPGRHHSPVRPRARRRLRAAVPGVRARRAPCRITRTLSVGMPVPSRVVGGLNVYARGDDADGSALDEKSVAVAEAFAGYAAIAVANAGLVHSTRRFAEHMVEAMKSRADIEQAQGLLVAQTGCTPDQAFAELRRRSSTQNRKLSAIAAGLIAQAQHGSADPLGSDQG